MSPMDTCQLKINYKLLPNLLYFAEFQLYYNRPICHFRDSFNYEHFFSDCSNSYRNRNFVASTSYDKDPEFTDREDFMLANGANAPAVRSWSTLFDILFASCEYITLWLNHIV